MQPRPEQQILHPLLVKKAIAVPNRFLPRAGVMMAELVHPGPSMRRILPAMPALPERAGTVAAKPGFWRNLWGGAGSLLGSLLSIFFWKDDIMEAGRNLGFYRTYYVKNPFPDADVVYRYL